MKGQNNNLKKRFLAVYPINLVNDFIGILFVLKNKAGTFLADS